MARHFRWVFMVAALAAQDFPGTTALADNLTKCTQEYNKSDSQIAASGQSRDQYVARCIERGTPSLRLDSDSTSRMIPPGGIQAPE
jgi:hypothetical protein